MRLLVVCAVRQTGFLSRMMPPSELDPFLEAVDAANISAAFSLLGLDACDQSTPRMKAAIVQMSMPADFGGLNLAFLQSEAPAAFYSAQSVVLPKLVREYGPALGTLYEAVRAEVSSVAMSALPCWARETRRVYETAVPKKRNRCSFERAGYPNGDMRQWDINPEAVRNKVYQTIKEQKEGGAITAVNTIAQPEGAIERETVTESIQDNVIGMPSDPLQLLAHAVCVRALPDVKSAAVKCTYQQIMHHQREPERLRHQELIVQNLPEHPLICEVLAFTPDKDKCSKRYKMPLRRRIMGEDAQMLCGERAMRALYTK
eukprot:jgi/Tetstr1/446324/TSEL_033867.t1